MIPILYEKDETAFISNGLGRLRDCISCVVTEERNGIYELDFEYPVDGSHYDDIQLGRIVAVEHDDTTDLQPFDIVSCSRPIDGIVTFHCQHISYRQSKLTVSGTNINSLADAFTMLGNSSPSNPFTYWTDKASTGYMAAADGVPRSVRSMLGGVEGSILDAYGGEYEWDKFTVRLHGARGEQRDITIRYGVNLTEYNEDIDYSGSYTACIPFWTGDNETGGTIVVKGSMVDSGAISHDGRTSCIPLDLTDKFENQPTAAQLESMARSMMASEQSYLPSQTIQVSFIRLQDTEEYRQYAALMTCRLCDTINVVFPRYNMSGKFKIVKTVYDVLRERFVEMELGTLSTSLAEALGIGVESSFSSGGGNFLELFYPVGSYYETSDSTFDPNVAWGGTWVSKTVTDAAVVESGDDGVWSYRKWSDGYAECWGRVNVASRQYAANGGYYNVTQNFPTGLFYQTPYGLSVSGGMTGNAKTLIGFTTANNKDSFQTYLINYNTSAVTNTAWVFAHAIGRWKATATPTTMYKWHRTA